MSTLRNLVKELDKRYPLSRAESWDAVGLLVGDPDAKLARVLVAHEITPDTLEEAQGCDAVLTYHPLIFRPLARLDFSDHTCQTCGRMHSARAERRCGAYGAR
jgi:putative NIF3 family GTP cyclohydrolase 1 type 2